VPSSGARTVWTGVLTVAPGVIVYVASLITHALPAASAGLEMAIRCAATVVASSIASRRIYGLRRQVAKSHRLGQYTLEEKVGAGGMGVVFKASHALLRRPTAIKLLRPDSVGEDTLAQFEREAQLTSQLTHPSTIQIYDFGRNDTGTFYYAMEYLEGLNLYELISLKGPQLPGRTIDLLVQICGSLAEAHAVGLVHRDIKPANIMLCERGKIADVVKVLDFGLARVRAQLATTPSGEATIAGTPGFMSPEAIIHPEGVDARSDIYAVGAVAYYLLTAEDLFGAKPDFEVLLDQVNTLPPPVSTRRTAPIAADLERLVMSCLAKDPKHRPQSADDLSERLLACHDARTWSRAHARAWWDSNRELVRQRVRERSTTIQGTFVPSVLAKRASD
jgi:eukaryotic-like serine/threonine-protein kinase